MKKFVLALSVLLISISSFSQKHTLTAKQNIVAGAVMTGVGDAMLGGGIGCLIIGIDQQNLITGYDALGYPEYNQDGSPLIITGSVLMAVGAALTIAGPILLVRGIKQKRSTTAYMSFTPIKNIFPSSFKTDLRAQKISSITFTF